MIFRVNSKGNKVGILEALGSGVQVFLWENFVKYGWHEQYGRIAFRSLIIPDLKERKEIKMKLALFVKTVVNRHYGWNPMQLIRKQSTVSLYDESRTFFCSELIAKAFKEVGLLRADFASSQYFPSHFQESKHLKLLKGCSFSKEMQVIWNENDVLFHQPWNDDNGSTHSQKQKKPKRKRSKTAEDASARIVSLQSGDNSNDKKQRFKSPPPRQFG